MGRQGQRWQQQNFTAFSRIDHAAQFVSPHLAAQISPAYSIASLRDAARAADMMLIAFDALARAAFAAERASSSLVAALAVLTQKAREAVAAGWLLEWDNVTTPKSRGRARTIWLRATAIGYHRQITHITWVTPAAVDLISAALAAGVNAQ